MKKCILANVQTKPNAAEWCKAVLTIPLQGVKWQFIGVVQLPMVELSTFAHQEKIKGSGEPNWGF